MMVRRAPVLIEGYTADELLGLPDAEISAVVFTGLPLTIRVGTAEILAEFKVDQRRLAVELAHIDSGGEGILLALSSVIQRYAASRSLEQIEWVVHALNCARPNLKLRRVLLRRGFAIRHVRPDTDAYHLIEPVTKRASAGTQSEEAP